MVPSEPSDSSVLKRDFCFKKGIIMTQAHYTVTVPTAEDIRPMLEMYAQSWRDTYPDSEAGVTAEWVEARVQRWLTDENIKDRQAKLKDLETNPDIAVWVVKNEQGEVIGAASPRRDETTQRVGSIYVDKQYHGQGIAQLLMDKIIAWADPKRPLELEVASYNERAKAFYRKYGFEVSGSEKKFADAIPIVAMVRKVEKS
jgi:ribosomal protein S18 acetylase RimI-like enzyme